MQLYKVREEIHCAVKGIVNFFSERGEVDKMAAYLWL